MMNIFIFIILQIVVNWILSFFIPVDTIYGIAAFYLASSLIISFIAAFMATPPGYKKEFLKQPGFHKTMLMYFGIFAAMDLVLILLRWI